MWASCAVRLKVWPVMPGAAANAAVAVDNVSAAIAAKSSRVFEIAFFIFVVLIAALLIDTDFSHQPAKVLGIVRQMVELRGIKVEHAAGRILRCIPGIQNHVERLATRQRYRVGVVVQVVS